MLSSLLCDRVAAGQASAVHPLPAELGQLACCYVVTGCAPRYASATSADDDALPRLDAASCTKQFRLSARLFSST